MDIRYRLIPVHRQDRILQAEVEQRSIRGPNVALWAAMCPKDIQCRGIHPPVAPHTGRGPGDISLPRRLHPGGTPTLPGVQEASSDPAG